MKSARNTRMQKMEQLKSVYPSIQLRGSIYILQRQTRNFTRSKENLYTIYRIYAISLFVLALQFVFIQNPMDGT